MQDNWRLNCEYQQIKRVNIGALELQNEMWCTFWTLLCCLYWPALSFICKHHCSAQGCGWLKLRFTSLLLSSSSSLRHVSLIGIAFRLYSTHHTNDPHILWRLQCKLLYCVLINFDNHGNWQIYWWLNTWMDRLQVLFQNSIISDYKEWPLSRLRLLTFF